MSPLTFQKAERSQSRGRIAIDGPAGAGKTLTALRLAVALLVAGKRIAVIDTEHGSASKYAPPAGQEPDNKFTFDFDVIELDTFAPATYVEIIHAAEKAGTYGVLVIDSLSHAWEGEGGALDMHDAATVKSGNSWTAWRDVTPEHRRMVDAILQTDLHVVTTMRSKMDTVQEQDERGKTVIRKVGMAPIQRQGMEYEFDLVADMDWDHNFVVSKSRFPELDGVVKKKPDVEWFGNIRSCLETGKALAPKPTPTPVKATQPAEITAPEADTPADKTPAEVIIEKLRADAALLDREGGNASKRPLFATNAAKILGKVLEDTDINLEGAGVAVAFAAAGIENAGLSDLTVGQLRAISRWLYDANTKALRPQAVSELGMVLNAPQIKAVYDAETAEQAA